MNQGMKLGAANKLAFMGRDRDSSNPAPNGSSIHSSSNMNEKNLQSFSGLGKSRRISGLMKFD